MSLDVEVLASRLKRAMLVALGIAAAAGVIAVLTGSGDVPAAVALTALWTAIACGSILKSSPWATRPGHEAAFVFAVAQTITLFVLATAYTWAEALDLFARPGETFVGGSMLAILGTGWCATLGLVLPARASEASTAGRTLVGTALLAFLCFEGAVIESAFDVGPDDDEMLATGAWCLGAGFTVALGALHERPRGRTLTLAAALSAAVATVIVMGEVWARLPESRVRETVLAASISVPVVVAQIRLLYVWPMPERSMALRRWTVYVGAATATAMVLVVATHGELEGLLRVTGALAILTAAGSLACTVVLVTERRRATRDNTDGTPSTGTRPRSGLPPLDELKALQLECPRCGHAQSLALGGAPCLNCGLRIVVEIDADPGR